MHKKNIQYLISAVIFIVLGIAYFIYRDHEESSHGNFFELDEGTVRAEETTAYVEETSGKVQNEERIYVYVCGYVKNAGVYTFPRGSRRYEAVDAAGGVTEDGSAEFLELAGVLTDGERIYVPSKAEAEEVRLTAQEQSSGLVNINKASKEQLMTLPGIGESRAEQIIRYRETNGPFEDIGDIMKISGIKEAAFAKIKEYICV
ncbi:MAG: helix-hairpin-helix domain-containing protein [Alistipes sp.]|nr:helix-hairpin-helix domain-containing protein [Alistipes sp.]